MRLTSEEHQKLRSNLQKIEDYIVSEICPHMCGTSVTVDFGEEKMYYGDKNGIENKYHITVTDKSVSGRTGYLGLAIVKKDNDSGSSFDTYVEAGTPRPLLDERWCFGENDLSAEGFPMVSCRRRPVDSLRRPP